MTRKWKRRDFLRHTAMSSLVAPIASFWSDLAEAQAPKTYMVLLFFPNGQGRRNPFITRSGASWSFGPGFTPFEKHRDDLIAIEQYSFQDFTRKHYRGMHQDHHANPLCMFSGEVPYATGPGDMRASMAPSIDQIVAWDYLRRGVIKDPLRRSLPIRIAGSCMYRGQSVFFQTPPDYDLDKTYATEMRPTSNLTLPEEGFKRMFGGLAALAGGAAVDKLWTFGRSILDVPAAELQGLAATLPGEGRALLDQNLQALRDLEKSLAGQATPLRPPEAPAPVAATPANHEKIWTSWVKVIDAAFRFDATRIATVQLGGNASRFQVPSLGLGYVGKESDPNSGTDHHSYTHWNEGKVPLFVSWYAQRATELIAALKGEGTGRANLLRDTVGVVGWEFGWNHVAHDVPVVLFGQGGGRFKTGRVLSYGNALESYHKVTGTLLAACHAMGVTGLKAVGHPLPEYQRGPVGELQG